MYIISTYINQQYVLGTVNPLPPNPEFKQTLKSKLLKTLLEKGQNAGKKHFLFFFPTMFSTSKKNMFQYSEPHINGHPQILSIRKGYFV